MDYTELAAAVASTTAQEFDPADMERFCRLTEQRIFNEIQPPVLRENMTGSTSAGNPYLTLPDGYLYTFTLASKDLLTGEYAYLLNKDVNYIREAFPPPNSVGRPEVYAQFDENTFILGPTPDAAYDVELHFAAYPESIVTAGTSWLGDNLDSVLFNGMLVEAARFMKEDEDIIKNYDKMFLASLAQAKSLSDGKLRQDTFRGQARVPVT